MKKACFVFDFDSAKEAKIKSVCLSGKTFKITIEASDLSSLRAAINSYLRWINTAIDVKKTI